MSRRNIMHYAEKNHEFPLWGGIICWLASYHLNIIRENALSVIKVLPTFFIYARILRFFVKFYLSKGWVVVEKINFRSKLNLQFTRNVTSSYPILSFFCTLIIKKMNKKCRLFPTSLTSEPRFGNLGFCFKQYIHGSYGL